MSLPRISAAKGRVSLAIRFPPAGTQRISPEMKVRDAKYHADNSGVRLVIHQPLCAALGKVVKKQKNSVHTGEVNNKLLRIQIFQIRSEKQFIALCYK